MDRKGAWLTPNTPAGGFICRTLRIPNGIDWLAIVNGALDELTKPWNFDAFGTSTVQQTVDAFAVMFDATAENTGQGCPLIGEIILYGSDTPPASNYLACDGSSVLRATWPDLFAVVGVTFGAVDGTHFNLPDLRGRVPMGDGAGVGLSPRTIGNALGEETHTLTIGELASHTHTDAGHSHVESGATPTVLSITAGVPIPAALATPAITASGSANILSTGSDTPHNNIQPSLALAYYIVAS